MTDNTIQEELAALREIAAKATPGEWLCEKAVYDEKYFIQKADRKQHGHHKPIAQANKEGDARLIASAPRLMALIERMAAEIERLWEEMDRCDCP